MKHGPLMVPGAPERPDPTTGADRIVVAVFVAVVTAGTMAASG